jgi:hypothetical protein
MLGENLCPSKTKADTDLSSTKSISEHISVIGTNETKRSG